MAERYRLSFSDDSADTNIERL